jgi:hypothetical protein
MTSAQLGAIEEWARGKSDSQVASVVLALCD